MGSNSMLGLRVLGLWLLYATVGLFLLLTADSGGLDVAEDSATPTRLRTKIVGALSGVALAGGALGAYVASSPDGRTESGIALFVGGVGIGAVLVASAMLMIYRDLTRKRGR